MFFQRIRFYFLYIFECRQCVRLKKYSPLLPDYVHNWYSISFREYIYKCLRQIINIFKILTDGLSYNLSMFARKYINYRSYPNIRRYRLVSLVFSYPQTSRMWTNVYLFFKMQIDLRLPPIAKWMEKFLLCSWYLKRRPFIFTLKWSLCDFDSVR